MANNSARRGRADRIDQIDRNILAALFNQARISKVQMSAEVGISASRCYERMQRLEQSGIVRGYHADIDITRLASSLQFLTQVQLLNYTGSRPRQFEKAVLKMPEIIACKSVLGQIDYVIVVVAASIERYQEVIAELRTQSGDEFNFVTFPVSKTIKSPGQSDLRQLLGRLALQEPSLAPDGSSLADDPA